MPTSDLPHPKSLKNARANATALAERIWKAFAVRVNGCCSSDGQGCDLCGTLPRKGKLCEIVLTEQQLLRSTVETAPVPPRPAQAAEADDGGQGAAGTREVMFKIGINVCHRRYLCGALDALCSVKAVEVPQCPDYSARLDRVKCVIRELEKVRLHELPHDPGSRQPVHDPT